MLFAAFLLIFVAFSIDLSIGKKYGVASVLSLETMRPSLVYLKKKSHPDIDPLGENADGTAKPSWRMFVIKTGVVQHCT